MSSRLSLAALAAVVLLAVAGGKVYGFQAGGDVWAQASLEGFDRAAAAARIEAAVQATDEASEKSYLLWKRSIKGEDVKAEQAALKRPPNLAELKEDALRVVKADPTDEAALKAMRVVLSSYREEPLREHISSLLFQHQLNRPDFLKVAQSLSMGGDDGSGFWQRVYNGSSNPQVRGNAAAVLMDNAFKEMSGTGISEQDRAALRAKGQAYAQEIKQKYGDARVSAALRLPRYMDQTTATLAEFVKNRETILAYSVGAKLPSIKVADLQGKMDELGNYRGKVLVVDFWATWCGPCKAGHPDLVALDKEMAGKPFEIIGISVDNKPEDVTKYTTQTLDLPWVQWYIGPTGKLLEDWGVQGFPTYLVVDANGVVVERTNHLTEASKEAIRKLVAKGS